MKTNLFFKDFKVVAKSDNTNSFGLYQMIVLSKDGEVFKTHASTYNAKEKCEFLQQEVTVNEDGKIINRFFAGTELTTQLKNAPKEIIEEVWGVKTNS